MNLEQILFYVMLVLPIVGNIAIVLLRDRYPVVAYWIQRLTAVAVATAASPKEKRAEVLVEEVRKLPLPDSAPVSVAAEQVEAGK